jgi:RimJ/RimL family protein N-acetyltransferase
VVVQGDGVRLRPADEADVAQLVALAGRPDVADFLAATSPWAEEQLREAIAAGRQDPDEGQPLLVEVELAGTWRFAGALGFSMANRRSRIAYLYGVMIDPAYRGRGLAEGAVRLLSAHLIRELGFHRLQLEVYGFNEAAQRVVERAGFVREGVRRKAYWRHGAWQDGVHYGLVEEDLDAA